MMKPPAHPAWAALVTADCRLRTLTTSPGSVHWRARQKLQEGGIHQCLPDRFGERKYLRETKQVRNKKDQEHEHDGADERPDAGIGPRRQTLNVAGELSRLRIAQRIDSRFYLT